MYQLVSTGTTFTAPAPDLKPDNDLSIELRAERQFADARLQLSLFQDDVHDAIISQFLPLAPNSTTLYSYLSNVDHVRARGIEFVGAVNDLLVPGLELTGNVTYTNARTLALSGRASASAPAGSAIGKRVPNIPDWRGTVLTTYRRNERLAVALGARYSAKVFTTLDNADVNPNTYQGFSSWFVMDAHTNYRVDRNWSGSLGIDNLLDRKYFLFHPFPQRTLVASLQYGW
jgi:iron complex outermembrane receptor protein